MGRLVALCSRTCYSTAYQVYEHLTSSLDSCIEFSDWCGVTRGTVIGSDAWIKAGPIARQGLYVGVGCMAVGRSELFRSEHGVALLMDQPVFQVPSAKGECQN